MNKALIIGINNYKQEDCPPLNGCINDAMAFSDMLTLGNFESKNIKFLYDSYATKDNIIKYLKWLMKGSGDKIFYFGGHGSQIADIDKDEIDGLDEIFITYDSYIIDDEIHKIARKSNIVFVFDSCHSGTINRSLITEERKYVIRTIPKETGFQYYSKNFLTKRNIKENNRYIAACNDNETAKEVLIDGTTRGVFTYKLIDLKKRFPKYGFKKIFSLLKEELKKYDQTPQTNIDDCPELF